MQKIRTFILTATIIFTVAIFGCKKEDNKTQTTNGNMQNVTLKGVVKDNNGNVMSGVKVSTGSLSATSDAKGKFSFNQTEVIESRAIIKFEKEGYFTLTRSREKTDELFIDAIMYKKGNSDISLQTTFEASSGKILTVNSGMTVKLAASSIKKADGSEYSGTVHANMLYLDPNNENFAGLMPGGDLAAIRSDNSKAVLISYGMTNVNLSDGAGNKLQLKSDAPAELTFPIPAGMENNPPATIPLWTFDEQKAIWIEEGYATLQGNVYIGTVNHFSWINLDKPENVVTLEGEVDCEDGVPAKFIRIEISTSNGKTAAYTDSKGKWSTIAPAGTNINVTADGCSNPQSIGSQQGNSKYNVPKLIVPCPEDEEDDDSQGGDTSQYAIKYMFSGGSDHVMILSVDVFNQKARVRTDMFTEEMHIITLTNTYTKETWQYMPYVGWMQQQYYEGAAETSEYTSTDSAIIDEGYTYEGTVVIAKKTCKLYTKPSDTGTDKIAIWNNLILLLETGGSLMEATAVTLTVPAKAFEKSTIEVDWI